MLYLSRPSREEVEAFVGLASYNIAGGFVPDDSEAEWGKSHREFVLRLLLPSIRPPVKVWRLVVEAYLCDVLRPAADPSRVPFEVAVCDGSTLVPDVAYRWGNMKDPWGVAHDYAYTLHGLGLADAYGHTWGFFESNAAYRDGWRAEHMPGIGWTWWGGLTLGGWVAWMNKARQVAAL